MPTDEAADRVAKPRSALIAPATAADAADAVDIVGTPLATLLAGNVIQQGELVQLFVKPSRWFVVLNSARFAAFTVVILAGLHLIGFRPLLSKSLCVQFGLFLVAGRVMWSTVEWMGRYYVLTDLRVVRVSGIFAVDIQSCPLRKVREVNFYTTVGERLIGRGCIEMTNAEKKMTWQTVARPRPIHRMVSAAVARSKSNGCGPL